MSVKPAPKEEEITLGVLTSSVDLYERFSLDEPLMAVKQWAAQAIGYGDPSSLILVYENTVLDPQVPISEYVQRYHWSDGTMVMLVPPMSAGPD